MTAQDLPLPLAAAPVVTGQVSFKGQRAWGLGFARDPENSQLVYLSLAGFRTAVRAVWAALMEGNAIEIGRDLIRRGDDKYQTTATLLPVSGLEHMIILHRQAAQHLAEVEPGFFYVLDNTDTPAPIALFLGLLDKTTAVPLLKDTGPDLARLLRARSEPLIAQLHAWRDGTRKIEDLDPALQTLPSVQTLVAIGGDIPVLARMKAATLATSQLDQRIEKRVKRIVTQLWGDYMWKDGLAKQLIQSFEEARGICGWRVSSDSALWLAMIKQGIAEGNLYAGNLESLVREETDD